MRESGSPVADVSGLDTGAGSTAGSTQFTVRRQGVSSSIKFTLPATISEAEQEQAQKDI